MKNAKMYTNKYSALDRTALWCNRQSCMPIILPTNTHLFTLTFVYSRV